MNPWITAALGLGAGWLLSHRPRVLRRTYRALLCRQHGLFNPDGVPFCPICQNEMESVSLFRRPRLKARLRPSKRRNPTRRAV